MLKTSWSLSCKSCTYYFMIVIHVVCWNSRVALCGPFDLKHFNPLKCPKWVKRGVWGTCVRWVRLIYKQKLETSIKDGLNKKECSVNKRIGINSHSRALPLMKIESSVPAKYNLPLETTKSCLKFEKNISISLAIFS